MRRTRERSAPAALTKVVEMPRGSATRHLPAWVVGDHEDRRERWVSSSGFLNRPVRLVREPLGHPAPTSASRIEGGRV
jgi:hypothetical protein